MMENKIEQIYKILMEMGEFDITQVEQLCEDIHRWRRNPKLWLKPVIKGGLPSYEEEEIN